MTEPARTVLLIRHGIAEEKGTRPDWERELTAKGHARMRLAARGIVRTFGRPDLVLSSPLVRAMQTTDWLIRSARSPLPMAVTDALRPGSEPQTLIDTIASLQEPLIACVGHEPHLSALMRLWTGITSAQPMELKKGGCYAIELRGGTALLTAMLPPRVFRP